MVRIQHLEMRVGMRRRKRLGETRGHDVVLRAMEDQCGLAEIGIVLVSQSIFHELIPDLARAVVGVMKNFHRAGALPLVGYGSELFRPAARETERRSQQ